MRVLNIPKLLTGIIVFLVSILPLVASVSVVPSKSLSALPTSKNAPYNFEVGLLYDGVLPYGSTPVVVRITNSSDRDGQWKATASLGTGYGNSQRTTENTVTLKVPAKSGATFYLLIPPLPTVTTRYSTHQYVNLDVQLSGPGTQSSNWSTGNSYDLTAYKPAALSKELYRRVGGQLTTASSNIGIISVENAQILPDWQGLSPFDRIWYSVDEWNVLEPERKAAVLAWVRLGGDLRLIDLKRTTRRAEGTIQYLEGIALTDFTISQPMGLGTASIQQIQDNDFLAKHIEATKGTLLATGINRVTQSHANERWDFLEEFTRSKFSILAVMGLMIIFPILVGPINLFVLAKGNKRHRLFITTPIISLTTTFLIIVIILLGDGIGGRGSRVALVYLDPDSKTASVTQKQLSMTGLLLSSSFDLEKDVYMQRIFQHDASRIETYTMSRKGDHVSGSVFENRNLQAHHLASSKPSRASISIVNLQEVSAGEPPIITSSVNGRLRKVYYIVNEKEVWVAEGVMQGERKTMKSLTATEAFSQFRSEVRSAGPLHADYLKDRFKTSGQIVAIGENLQDFFIPTLGAIDWQQEECFIITPVGKQG